MNKKLAYLAVAVFIFILLSISKFVFSFTVAVIFNSQMPTITSKNTICLGRKIHNTEEQIKRGTLVIMRKKQNNSIAKILGLPGEKVEILDRNIKINDQIIDTKDFVKITKDENNKTPELKGIGILLKDNEYFTINDYWTLPDGFLPITTESSITATVVSCS